jgi:hypothetical protein
VFFLKDDRLLLASPNAYNSLGVGTTQLYDKTVVYNHKRHGDFSLGGRKFAFRVKPAFPKSLTKEFLPVDLVNNVDQLAEAKDEVLKRVMERTASSDGSRLRRAVRDYGNERTKKFFERPLTASQRVLQCLVELIVPQDHVVMGMTLKAKAFDKGVAVTDFNHRCCAYGAPERD